MPVHGWIKRHAYSPLVKRGWSSDTVAVLCFLFSATLHEAIISAPLRTVKLWAFTAMIAQIPLCAVTRKVWRKSQFGNLVFWGCILLGQPLAVLMYYYEA